MNGSLPKYARDTVRLLDPVKVRDARVRAGISDATLCSALGVAVNVIRSLEHGTDQCYFNLRFVRDLARALAVQPEDLFHSPADTDTSDRVSDDCDDSDVAAAGGLLAEIGEIMSVDVLATALGWTSARTLVALDSLDARLTDVGQTLQWIHGTHVAVCAIRPAGAVLDRATSQSLAERGLSRREAALLATVATGPPIHRYADIPKLVLRRLRCVGFIEAGVIDNPEERKAVGRRAEGARLTELARYNLVLDEVREEAK